jgi:3-oxoacyl-[acyl-carrier protein] reductase
MLLSDLRIAVTGAASGLGRCFTLELARAGASVAAFDLSADHLTNLAEEAEDLPGTVHGFACDVSLEADVVRAMDEAWERFGSLNGLINNAGIFRDHLLIKKDRASGDFIGMSLADWQKVIDVDLTGPFLCTRELALRIARDGVSPSVIVNISSIARHGNPGQSNYSAAKAGLVADTRLWAIELARYGVRVGAIAPGFVDTPILQGMRPDVLERMLSGVPLGRASRPEEIWQGVRFVLECDYFTGRCIDLDGGLSL